MSKEIGMKLANFVVETSYPEIPKETIDFTKALILKTTAGMVAGVLHGGRQKDGENHEGPEIAGRGRGDRFRLQDVLVGVDIRECFFRSCGGRKTTVSKEGFSGISP